MDDKQTWTWTLGLTVHLLSALTLWLSVCCRELERRLNTALKLISAVFLHANRHFNTPSEYKISYANISHSKTRILLFKVVWRSGGGEVSEEVVKVCGFCERELRWVGDISVQQKSGSRSHRQRWTQNSPGCVQALWHSGWSIRLLYIILMCFIWVEGRVGTLCCTSFIQCWMKNSDPSL